ncbi:MAG TPA: tetratricopeptide repeat protein [Polyangiaceae bacterium]
MIFSLLTACAPSHGAAYDRAFAEAARAESAGRLAEAVADFDRAAASAIRQRDRDQARWGAAQVMERSGPMAAALARLEAIAADGTSEHQPEAAYRAAVLRIDHGDTDRGWADLERVPRRFPSSGVGHVAVRRLVAHADEKGPEGAFAELHALAHDLAGTELEELVAFSTAQHLEARGDDDAARGAYVHIADRWPYPYGAFFDDALWRASLLDEKLGRYQVAVDELERMVAQRETTTLVGSYERAKYVPAMLRIGELYRDRLHDHARARDAFHRLYAGFAHSTRRDDALWLEADLWRQDGDAGKACDRLATLVQDFPDSRYVPCATGQCAGLERPAGSGAPKECRPYITREGWEPKAE